MAVAYESVSIGTWEGNQSGETLVITKPTGLAVGDLMILHLSAVSETGDPSNYGWTATGWTQVISEADTATSPKMVLDVYKKTADAGDVAASDFTFTHQENDVPWTNGAIYRISGAVTDGIQVASDLIRGDTTPSYDNTITQTYPNSLLLFLVTAVDDAASGSVASYAITNDNPTWTERYDSYADSAPYGGPGVGDGLMAGATAMRTQTTATGNSSVTLTNFNGSIGVLLVIPPVVSVSGNHAILTSGGTITAGTVSVGTTATHSILTSGGSIHSNSGDITENRWSNQSRNSKTWTNLPR